MTLRQNLKRVRVIKEIYLFCKYIANSIISLRNKIWLMIFHSSDWKLLRDMNRDVSAFYPQNFNFTNHEQYHLGKNVIGYPPLANIVKDGHEIGWGTNVFTWE